MKYNFSIDYYRMKTRYNFGNTLIFRMHESIEEFVKRTELIFTYNTVIDIENDDMKIITDTIETDEVSGVTTKKLNVSEIKTIFYKNWFCGNRILLSFLVGFIFVFGFSLIYFLKVYKTIFLLLFFSIPFLYFIMDNILMLMAIEKKMEI